MSLNISYTCYFVNDCDQLGIYLIYLQAYTIKIP